MFLSLSLICAYSFSGYQPREGGGTWQGPGGGGVITRPPQTPEEYEAISRAIEWAAGRGAKPTPDKIDYSNPAAFEDSLFQQFGRNPFAFNLMEEVDRATEQNAPQLFEHLFPDTAWQDRSRLNEEAQTFWRAKLMEFRAYAAKRLKNDNDVLINRYNHAMNRFKRGQTIKQAQQKQQAIFAERQRKEQAAIAEKQRKAEARRQERITLTKKQALDEYIQPHIDRQVKASKGALSYGDFSGKQTAMTRWMDREMNVNKLNPGPAAQAAIKAIEDAERNYWARIDEFQKLIRAKEKTKDGKDPTEARKAYEEVYHKFHGYIPPPNTRPPKRRP